MIRRLIADPRVRRTASVLVALALAIAVVLQRNTVIEAAGQLATLSAAVIGALFALAVLDRILRAELMRSLLPPLSLARAELVSDIGAAATKGLPAGGPLATVLRWQIATQGGVGPIGFLTMLFASGVATAFVGWTLPLVATVVDTLGRPTDAVDVWIIAVSLVVLGGALVFWAVLLMAEWPQRWLVVQSGWIIDRLAAFVPALADADAATVVARLRGELRRIAARPWPLLARTTATHLNGALILWVALQGLGVGPELGVTEFARVFFVAHIVGSFAPTPGGVGLIEVGLSAALIAAGVNDASAVAGVVIYRTATFVMPILIGTVLYVVWRRWTPAPPPNVAPDRDSAPPAGSLVAVAGHPRPVELEPHDPRGR